MKNNNAIYILTKIIKTMIAILFIILLCIGLFAGMLVPSLKISILMAVVIGCFASMYCRTKRQHIERFEYRDMLKLIFLLIETCCYIIAVSLTIGSFLRIFIIGI